MKAENSDFTLNIGSIYVELQRLQPRYILGGIYLLEETIQDIHRKENIVSFPWNGDHNYFERKIKQLRILESQRSPLNLPIDGIYPPTIIFNEYYITSIDGMHNLTFYGESFQLTRLNYPTFYDYFFALKLIFIDKMKILEFFKFQLEENFDNNISDFLNFLRLIEIKYYQEFDKENFQNMIDYFKNSNGLIKNLSQRNDIDSSQKNESTLFKTLALYYIFQELNIDNHRTSEAKVRFVNMLIGKNATSIKDILKNPFDKKQPETVRKTLIELIKYFEDLKLSNVVESINKDLTTITIKNKI